MFIFSLRYLKLSVFQILLYLVIRGHEEFLYSSMYSYSYILLDVLYFFLYTHLLHCFFKKFYNLLFALSKFSSIITKSSTKAYQFFTQFSIINFLLFSSYIILVIKYNVLLLFTFCVRKSIFIDTDEIRVSLIKSYKLN